MKAGQLSAEVDVPVKASGVVESVRVGDLLQEALHAAPLPLHEIVHEQHVLLLSAKPAITQVQLHIRLRVLQQGWEINRKYTETFRPSKQYNLTHVRYFGHF